MSRFWNFFKRKNKDTKRYDFWRLIDAQERDVFNHKTKTKHVICDIDKTYLETEFESILKMVKVALESAESKITVLGATALLGALRWGNQRGDAEEFPRPLHFISSSPPQLRPVLEEKLMLDGLDWSTDTFKNQAYNVLKGRVDLLSHHIAYKSAAILRIMQLSAPGSEFWMIGDNAESDAYIYTGAALFCSRSLDASQYREYLEAAGVDSKVAHDIAAAFAEPPPCSVGGILIRNAPGYRFLDAPPLTDHIILFDHYLEAFLIMMSLGLIDPVTLPDMVRQFHNRYGFSLDTIKQYLLPFASLMLPGVDSQQCGTLELAAKLSLQSWFTNTAIPPALISAEQALAIARTWSAKIVAEKKSRKEQRSR